MSPKAGFVLLDQIEPRLRATMPHIRGVGSEDTEELLQDAMAVAAKMLHDLEERGKEVTPGNVAYYTILHMKSGRRSYSAGRTDVMNAGTQLDSNAMVLSFEEPAGYDPDTDEEIPLGDMLAGTADDPAMAASRFVDWEEFLDTHNPRYGAMVTDFAQGKRAKDTAARFGFSSSWAHDLKEKLAEDLREHFGQDVIADSLHAPSWRGNIMVDHEKAACRADRRRG
ncbi:MAG: hypothetical protein D4R65_14400 [Verrucomicrobiaceae bacterium]|nr:MAG: hypothetical protein D4R65_14400 [Verrucomicrobiaceae bacterium]